MARDEFASEGPFQRLLDVNQALFVVLLVLYLVDIVLETRLRLGETSASGWLAGAMLASGLLYVATRWRPSAPLRLGARAEWVMLLLLCLGLWSFLWYRARQEPWLVAIGAAVTGLLLGFTGYAALRAPEDPTPEPGGLFRCPRCAWSARIPDRPLGPRLRCRRCNHVVATGQDEPAATGDGGATR